MKPANPLCGASKSVRPPEIGRSSGRTGAGMRWGRTGGTPRRLPRTGATGGTGRRGGGADRRARAAQCTSDAGIERVVEIEELTVAARRPLRSANAGENGHWRGGPCKPRSPIPAGAAGKIGSSTPANRCGTLSGGRGTRDLPVGLEAPYLTQPGCGAKSSPGAPARFLHESSVESGQAPSSSDLGQLAQIALHSGSRLSPSSSAAVSFSGR